MDDFFPMRRVYTAKVTYTADCKTTELTYFHGANASLVISLLWSWHFRKQLPFSDLFLQSEILNLPF